MSASTGVAWKKKPRHEVIYTSGNEKTFSFDDLPPLPVPPLRDTLDRYLMWVRPHVSNEEYENTEEIVKKFANGVGKDLHEKLVAVAASKKNWLEDWWLHYAYLTVRDPILPTMNTTGPMPLNLTLWQPSFEEVFRYAALYIWAMLDFFVLLREERLMPQKAKDGTRFSMEQFRRLFNCSRIPGQGADSLYTRWKTKDEGECPDHLIVLCHGHIWTVHPWDSEGKAMNPPELEQQFRHIRERSDAMGPGAGLPVLTCDTRENWAKNRDWLKSLSLNNSQNLDHIESALFVFVMDDTSPANFEELCWEALCGDTTNRWADKSLTAIMTRNGFGATNNDHTPYDAMVTVVMAHYQHLLLEDMGGTWRGNPTVREFPMPSLVNFDLDSKIMAAIPAAKETSLALTKNIDVRYYTFSTYGKDFIKNNKLHPDAFVQMSMQLAYFRLHGKPAPTYETATTRQFYNGRTETMRSCTVEAVEFARSMLNPKASTSEKRTKLFSAVKMHNELMNHCQKNEGIDRHLFGLYIIALEAGMDMPEIFLDPAYVKSGGGGNFVLSSSTTGYTPLVGGVAAMVQDGYGCFYNMLPDKLNFFVSTYLTSKETRGEDFCRALSTSLQDMHDVLTAPTASL